MKHRTPALSESRSAAAAMAAPSSGRWPDAFHGGSMYINLNEGRGPPGRTSYDKPRLSRLGTFRELTRSGGAAFADMFATDTADGCVLNSSSSYTCVAPG